MSGEDKDLDLQAGGHGLSNAEIAKRYPEAVAMATRATLPVLDPATKRVTGEVEVDAALAVSLPDLDERVERDAMADRMLVREMERREGEAERARHGAPAALGDEALELSPELRRSYDEQVRVMHGRDSHECSADNTNPCDNCSRLRVVAGLQADVERLHKECDGMHATAMRVAVERDDDRAQLVESERRALETHRILKLRVTAIESDLGIKITDHAEPLDQRLLRVRSVLLHGARAARAKANTLKRWQARARKAEARVAVLTQERDGLTLRLGEKDRGRVQRGASTTPPPTASAPLKRGDRVRLSARGRARSTALRRYPRGVVMGQAPDGSGDVLVLRDRRRLSIATPADLWERDDAEPARTRKGER